MNKPHSVELRLDSCGGLSLEPDVIGLDQLRYPDVRVECPQGHTELQRVDQRVFAQEQIQPITGLAYAIAEVLRGRGRTVRFIREAPLLNPGGIQAGVDDDTTLAEFIRRNPAGLVDVGRGVDVFALIADLIRLLNEARFMIVFASKEPARKLARFLQKRKLPASLVISAPPIDLEPVRVVIATVSNTAHGALETNRRDLYLFPRASDSLHVWSAASLSQTDFGCRVFGFHSLEQRLSPSEQIRLRMIFGHAHLVLPAPGLVERLPRLFHYQRSGGGGIPREARAHQVLQKLWKDRVRNRELAEIAQRAFRPGELPGSVRVEGGTEFELFDQVILLVDTVEHAGLLAQRLPGWPVRVREYDATGLPAGVQAALDRGRTGWAIGDRWIVTEQAAGDIEIFQREGNTLVIWAGGRVGLPPLPSAWSLRPGGSRRTLVLLDIQDRHHPLLRRWNRERREAYQAAGWIEVGDNPDQVRAEHLLQQLGGTLP